MLGLIRRHSRSILIKLIYVGLILSFLVWGIGSYNSRDDFTAVDVNGEKIPMSEYQQSFDRLITYYKESLKDNFNDEMIAALNLKKVAIDSLINRILLLSEADKLGIKVSNDEIRASIQSYPAFQKNERFDKETYFNVLKRNRLKPGEFEKDQEVNILSRKVEGTIKSTAVVTDDEVLAAYKEAKTTVNLEFIKLNSDKYVKSAKPSESEMKDFFAANIGLFTIPEKIKLGYVVFNPKHFVKKINLGKEDFDDYYTSYITDFTEPDKVKASHILIKSGDNKEEARTKAKDIYNRVLGGERFSKLAKDFSEDDSSAAKGGSLGFFARGDMVKSFEDAAFSMKKGEISRPVESIYGFHIIKVEDFIEGKVKPLKEVKNKIKTILETEISKELAINSAEDIYYEALKGKAVKELAGEEKVPFKSTGLFIIDNIPEDLRQLENEVRSATVEPVGWVSRPIEMEDKIYIITLLEKNEPREPTYKEVKTEVKEAVSVVKSEKKAESMGEIILKDSKGNNSFKKLAKKYGAKAGETAFFTRSNKVIPEIGVSQELANVAFQLSKESPLPDKTFKVGSDVFIVKFKAKRDISMEEFEKEKVDFKSKLLEKRREEVFRKWLEETRSKATITYHEDLADLQG